MDYSRTDMARDILTMLSFCPVDPEMADLIVSAVRSTPPVEGAPDLSALPEDVLRSELARLLSAAQRLRAWAREVSPAPVAPPVYSLEDIERRAAHSPPVDGVDAAIQAARDHEAHMAYQRAAWGDCDDDGAAEEAAWDAVFNLSGGAMEAAHEGDTCGAVVYLGLDDPGVPCALPWGHEGACSSAPWCGLDTDGGPCVLDAGHTGGCLPGSSDRDYSSIPGSREIRPAIEIVCPSCGVGHLRECASDE